ncbi:hypothetical protein PLICRDRAFT_155721 [Plicaturopsis crispa FD-325 SS-3]|nr:hypothetical protein PLICRDRAFT_155721 [Plicaturopsis crispa FD-325 SS-3]
MVRQRLKLSPAATLHGGASGTSLNTAALLAHESAGGAPGEPKAMVCWQVRVSNQPKQINHDLPNGNKLWAYSMWLSDIKAHVLQQIAVDWNRNGAAPLLDEEVQFRWNGNRVFEKDTSTMRLGEFVMFHQTPTMSFYLDKIPSNWKAHAKGKTPCLCFELYIDYHAYSKRLRKLRLNHSDSDDNDELEDTSGTGAMVKSMVRGAAKRSRPLSDSSEVNKRQRVPSSAMGASSPFKSTFRASSQSGGLAMVQTRSDVNLKKIVYHLNDVDGTYEFEDPQVVVRGRIRDVPFNSGAMKHAYDLILDDGGSYVAKRFFKTGGSEGHKNSLFDDDSASQSAGPVTVAGNEAALQGELGRLALGKWCLRRFYEHARSNTITVDFDIAFARAFLGKEIDRPSRASGVNVIDEANEGITWLIEERRPQTVIRFSGTLAHRSIRRDLRSATISAFAHFAWGASKYNFVLADLQGTPHRVRGKDGLILFDLMTHTLEGESGVGDFGREGISTFFRDHSCNSICREMRLDSEMPLRFVEREESPRGINSDDLEYEPGHTGEDSGGDDS